ncbi:MAG: DNA topoisomerase IV subunit A, partial [Rhodospirillales bacterium]|nr:DNA topoisomerase IV subunit A [Rhodospirillales bacterium]
NMRLRALRKLDEAEIREEHDRLTLDAKALKSLLKNEKARWQVIAGEIRETRDSFGAKTELGRRRTEIGSPPSAVIIPIDIAIEREPITVVCSKKGWIRAFKGHLGDDIDIKYKEGDETGFRFHAETTDKLILFATNGRFYTLSCDGLPPGRGNGEPVRLMTDLSNDHEIIRVMPHKAGQKLLVASSDGRGFIVNENDVIAQTRTGKQVLNVKGDLEAHVCCVVAGDHVAVIGENRKLLIFPTGELPEMTRGRGVKLQAYRDGGLSDVTTFNLDDGLRWESGSRTRTENDLMPWTGKRSQAGRLPPRGFPQSNRFSS